MIDVNDMNVITAEVLAHARLSLLANNQQNYSDETNDHRLDGFLNMSNREWNAIKEWAIDLKAEQCNENIREMCKKIQMVRDLQE